MPDKQQTGTGLASSPLAKDHPMMIAWESYKQTEDFKNSKHWALTVAPMIQHGDPDAERKRYSLMPIEQRAQHVDGSLWAAFVAGYTAAPPLTADMKAALERSKEELTLASDQWLNPNKDGLFKSRVSVLLDKIDALLSKLEGGK